MRIFCWKRRSVKEIDKQVTRNSKSIENAEQRIDKAERRIDALQRPVAAAPAPAPAPVKSHLQHLPKRLEDYSRHVRLLRFAAGLATARLHCHRDTWAYLTEKAAPQPQHFRIPSQVADCEGRIETTLSGRSLIAVLTALWDIAHSSPATNAQLGDWALAITVYSRIARAVERLRQGRQCSGNPVVIDIDRRPRSDGPAVCEDEPCEAAGSPGPPTVQADAAA